MNILEELLKLSEINHEKDLKRGLKEHLEIEYLFKALEEEIDETKAEVKPNNIPYLEDELADILWGWYMLTKRLEKIGYITNQTNIMQRALKKFQERVLPMNCDIEHDNIVWDKVKQMQKQRLKIEQFRYEVREFYKPYYNNSDEAHLIDHADSVCDLALKLNNKEFDEKLVILSAYLHDIFNAKDRKNHHILAYEYVLEANDKFLKKLSQKELKMVAHAVLEHRASFKGEFYSKLSEIISSADRDEPNLDIIIIRSLKYNNGNAKDVLTHIKSKYSTDGYGRYPTLYKEYFKVKLQKFRDRVDNLTIKEIEKFKEYI